MSDSTPQQPRSQEHVAATTAAVAVAPSNANLTTTNTTSTPICTDDSLCRKRCLELEPQQQDEDECVDQKCVNGTCVEGPEEPTAKPTSRECQGFPLIFTFPRHAFLSWSELTQAYTADKKPLKVLKSACVASTPAPDAPTSTSSFESHLMMVGKLHVKVKGEPSDLRLDVKMDLFRTEEDCRKGMNREDHFELEFKGHRNPAAKNGNGVEYKTIDVDGAQQTATGERGACAKATYPADAEAQVRFTVFFKDAKDALPPAKRMGLIEELRHRLQVMQEQVAGLQAKNEHLQAFSDDKVAAAAMEHTKKRTNDGKKDKHKTQQQQQHGGSNSTTKALPNATHPDVVAHVAALSEEIKSLRAIHAAKDSRIAELESALAAATASKAARRGESNNEVEVAPPAPDKKVNSGLGSDPSTWAPDDATTTKKAAQDINKVTTPTTVPTNKVDGVSSIHEGLAAYR